jgi:hypothetical protein
MEYKAQANIKYIPGKIALRFSVCLKNEQADFSALHFAERATTVFSSKIPVASSNLIEI